MEARQADEGSDAVHFGDPMRVIVGAFTGSLSAAEPVMHRHVNALMDSGVEGEALAEEVVGDAPGLRWGEPSGGDWAYTDSERSQVMEMTLKRTYVLIAMLVLALGFFLGLTSRSFHPRGIVRAFVSKRTSNSKIEAYLRTNLIRKLQIGAGPNDIRNWLNTDIEPKLTQAYLDATRPFPLPDKSMNYIYAEQLIEHLSYEDGLRMFAECRRVLVRGGKIRIATPDLQRLVTLYENSAPQRRFMEQQLLREGIPPDKTTPPCFILNMYFHYWGHQFVYDKETLKAALESSGFRDVRNSQYGKSEDPVLSGLERHISVVGPDIDLYVTMIVEAVTKD